MVYSTPADTVPAFRPQHRRTRSHNATFSSERTDGAFVSLGALPRRKPTSAAKKFHFRAADDDDDDDAFPPPLDAVTKKGAPVLNSLGLSVDTENLSPARRPSPQLHSIPFPRSSPRNSPSGPPSPRPFSPRPSLMQRTPSSPVIRLSNGKPLKSSLKSSTSSPHLPALHIRAQSAPSTPSIKSVHFGDEDEDDDDDDNGADDAKRPIEYVRVFKSSGKPANLLSFKPGEDTETETEAESSGYPFPTMPPLSPSPSSHWEIDFSPTVSSPIPQPTPSPYANIHVETVALPKTRPYTLRGSVLVRNLAFTKNVVVRFTLDDWQTTSEVTCKHVVSLPGLPPPFPRTRTVGDAVGLIAHSSSSPPCDDKPPPDGKPLWDRFSFVIRLEDYEHRLSDRTLYMVARFGAPGVGEWWDNNDGRNYKVGFKKVVDLPSPVKAPSSPVLSSSQQGSFRAPSTLRSTPVTSLRTDEKPGAPVVGVGARSPPLVRTNSGPPGGVPGMLPYTPPPAVVGGGQRRPSVSMKLKLANYAAPTSGGVGGVPSVGMGASPSPLSPLGGGSPVGFGSPPKVASLQEESEREREERIEDVEREWKEGFYWDGRYMREEEEGRERGVEVKMVGEIVGGQFVSSVVAKDTEAEGKEEGEKCAEKTEEGEKEEKDIPTPSMSSAESSPPDSGVSTPVNGHSSERGSGSVTPQGVGAKDDSYAAFVRQWCFAQTGARESRWLGFEGGGGGGGADGFGFGVGMGMGRRLGEGGMGVGSA